METDLWNNEVGRWSSKYFHPTSSQGKTEQEYSSVLQCFNCNSESLNMFEIHFKFEVEYLWETVEVGVQEAGLDFLKTLKENNLQNRYRLLWLLW